MQCSQCGATTGNPKFCSQSCAAKYSNKAFPRRKPEGHCKTCRKPIKARHVYCSEHRPPTHLEASKFEALTNDTQQYRRIRGQARLLAQRLGLLKKCLICGYTLHVEACHKKSIESHPLDARLSEINAPSNLVGLCRNHHWEFDHGFLNLAPEADALST